jgi:hypothetical protein
MSLGRFGLCPEAAINKCEAHARFFGIMRIHHLDQTVTAGNFQSAKSANVKQAQKINHQTLLMLRTMHSY